MNFDRIDYESFYVVRPGDNLWKIASQFEITNSEIQRFSKYLIEINPFLTKQKKKRPGDYIKSGDVIMLGTPDYTYQSFQRGMRPYPTVPMNDFKRREVTGIINRNRLDQPQQKNDFYINNFFRYVGLVNNGASGIDLERIPFKSYGLRKAVNNYQKFIDKSVRLIEKGQISQSSFTLEHNRHMKNIGDQASEGFQKLYKSYNKSLRSTRYHVGNHAKKTFNKNVIRLPKKTREIVGNGTRTLDRSMNKNFGWMKKGTRTIFWVTLAIDVSLRTRDIINTEKSKRGREFLVQSCGLGGALMSGYAIGAICGGVGALTHGIGFLPCVFSLGAYGIDSADSASKDLCGQAYDWFINDNF